MTRQFAWGLGPLSLIAIISSSVYPAADVYLVVVLPRERFAIAKVAETPL